MLNADPLLPRPTLTNPSLLATALDRLSSGTESVTEVWRVLTENYAVDLDTVAMLLPRQEPEPIWLAARD